MRYARYLFLVFALPAVAKTPDGKTPSVETVCDVYKGAAYGLCNSYCEARDCDDPGVRAADRSCAVTAAHFKKLTGADMPCDAAPACTVSATDDVTSDMTYNVLSNDKSSLSSLSVESYKDATGDVTLDAKGTYEIVWPADETKYVRTIEYTICCDSATCDTATAELSAPPA